MTTDTYTTTVSGVPSTGGPTAETELGTGWWDDAGWNASIAPSSSNASDGGAGSGGVESASAPQWAALGLVTVIVLGLTANTVVVGVVASTKRLHGPFFVMVVSLAAGDIVKSVTVMPLSVLRLLLGENVPWWTCRVWSQFYLSFIGLTLSHIIVALLHCHMALQGSICFRYLTDSCIVGIQVAVAWVLPVLLSMLYTLFTGAEALPITCRSLDRVFASGAFLASMGPALLATIVYIQVVITVNIQRRAARNMNPDPTSEVSSNGFVTYENSEASVDDFSPSTRKKMASVPDQPHTNGHVATASNSGSVAAQDLKTQEAIEGNVEQVGDHAEGVEKTTITTLDVHEPMSTDGDEASPVAHSDDSAAGQLKNIEDKSEETDQSLDENPSNKEQGFGDHPNLNGSKEADVPGDDKNDDCPSSTDQANVNKVLVKTKVGKEALNEPLDDDVDEVQLQMDSIIMVQVRYSGGVINPAFTLGDSDMPLSESIKPRMKPLDESIVVKDSATRSSTEGLEGEHANGFTKGSSDSSPLGISRTSSFSADENGKRSILKWDRNKRSSNKSVKFTLPPEEETQPQKLKPRLLSCKYRVHKGQSGNDAIPVLNGVKENLAKTAEFRYLVQAQRDQGYRLHARIKRQSRQAHLLLGMLMMCLACCLPYIITLLLLWFRAERSDRPKTVLLLTLLEWLSYLPYIIYPLMYTAFLADFRKALKGMGHAIRIRS